MNVRCRSRRHSTLFAVFPSSSTPFRFDPHHSFRAVQAKSRHPKSGRGLRALQNAHCPLPTACRLIYACQFLLGFAVRLSVGRRPFRTLFSRGGFPGFGKPGLCAVALSGPAGGVISIQAVASMPATRLTIRRTTPPAGPRHGSRNPTRRSASGSPGICPSCPCSRTPAPACRARPSWCCP